jgi:Arc/MetJ-type ribon-helix-helix transcriptional regulator
MVTTTKNKNVIHLRMDEHDLQVYEALIKDGYEDNASDILRAGLRALAKLRKVEING